MNAVPAAAAPVRFVDRHIPTVVARIAHELDEEMRAKLKRERVDPPAFRALLALRDAPPGGEAVTRLAGLCSMQQPTMTKLLDRLAAAGLATRLPDGRDRRVVRAALTVGGVLAADRLAALAERHERDVLERFPALAAAGLPEVLAAMVGRDGR